MHKYIYTYIYIIKKRKEGAKRFFPLFVLFHSRTHTTTVVFMLLASFTSLWMLDQPFLAMTLSVSGLFQTSQPWSLSTWFVYNSQLLDLYNLTSAFFNTTHFERFRIVTCPHAPLGCPHSPHSQRYLYSNIEEIHMFSLFSLVFIS